MNRESDGERFIRVTLEYLGIKYRQEKEINFLKGDYKGNRRADFFLPEYNTYIEFLGGWDKKNLEERKHERERYNNKKKAYSQNNLNCIYIYPSHLINLSEVIKTKLNLKQKVKPIPFYKDSLSISIATALIFTFLLPVYFSIFFVLLFTNILFIISFVLTRCPNCKRVFAKEQIRRDFEKIEYRPYIYRVETKYLYSDGTYKNSQFSEQKTKMERILVHRNVKKCKYCGYNWPQKEERNMDKSSRPSTIKIYKTKIKNPSKR